MQNEAARQIAVLDARTGELRIAMKFFLSACCGEHSRVFVTGTCDATTAVWFAARKCRDT